MISVSLAPRRKKRKRKTNNSWIAALFIMLLILGAQLGWLWGRYDQYKPYSFKEGTTIFYHGIPYLEKALYQQEMLYIPFKLVYESIDPSIKWDENKSLLIITTREDVYHLFIDELQYLHNLKEKELKAPVIMEQNKVYLPLDFLQGVYSFDIIEKRDQGLVIIHNIQKPILNGIIDSDSRLRHKKSILTPWSAEVKKGEIVKVFNDEDSWFWVETLSGDMGYIKKDRIELAGITSAETKAQVFHPYNPLGVPIFHTWEYAGAKTANTARIGKLPGVQILSPTWFDLRENGEVEDRADSKYIEWAHKEGFKVWGVFSNNCEIDLTHTFLTDYAARKKAISQLLQYIDKYRLDGLDVDFEYMYMEDKESYVQFIRELTPLVHEKGVSINVYLIFHSNSENWSLCYDHKALADVADYVTVMAYDEHTHLAGSTASFPWVERGIVRMLKDVPNEKLILGIPLYTRLWKETLDSKGDLKTTRQTLSLDGASSWANAQKSELILDKVVGQNYLEVVKDDAVYKMWLEDNYSLGKRIELAKKYRLAGIAAWRRGLERDDTWQFLSSQLDKRW